MVANGLHVYYSMFLMPPSLDVLRKRLEDRGTDKKDDIERRISAAQREIELALQLRIFHAIIKNDEKEEFLKTCSSQIEQWYPFLKQK
jgi:guanylate kinase